MQENYTKSECQITMRDGIRLFTIIYSPKDTSANHPILLNRTPYSVAPYGGTEMRSDLWNNLFPFKIKIETLRIKLCLIKFW